MFKLLRNLDFSNLPNLEGWSKKDVANVLEETRKGIHLYIDSREKASDFSIEQICKKCRACVATLPPSYLNQPYSDFMENKCPQLEDASEAKKRSRLEWENAVRTRTGKRPRRVGCSVERTTRAQTEAKTMTTMTEEDSTLLASSTLGLSEVTNNATLPVSSKQTRSNRTVVASTPMNEATTSVFAVPSTSRPTRAKRVTTKASKVAGRVLSSQDTISSSRGSVILNPFSLIHSKDQPKPSANEIQQLERLVQTVQKYLHDVKP